ncbi:MAG: hypothetical protein ACK4NC_02660 [Candidatus Gracilibacteria bacterium]
MPDRTGERRKSMSNLKKVIVTTIGLGIVFIGGCTQPPITAKQATSEISSQKSTDKPKEGGIIVSFPFEKFQKEYDKKIAEDEVEREKKAKSNGDKIVFMMSPDSAKNTTIIKIKNVGDENVYLEDVTFLFYAEKTTFLKKIEILDKEKIVLAYENIALGEKGTLIEMRPHHLIPKDEVKELTLRYTRNSDSDTEVIVLYQSDYSVIGNSTGILSRKKESEYIYVGNSL